MKLKNIFASLTVAAALSSCACVYSERNLPAPTDLANREFVVANGAYVAVGRGGDYSCLEKLGSIERQIVGPDAIENYSIGRKYFTSQGLKVETLKKGMTFRLTGVIAASKHGISTIDSGSGPIYFLILKDRNDTLYRIPTVGLGINRSDLFMSLVDSSQPYDASSIKMLDSSSFNKTSQREGKNAITYSGELVEVTRDFLDKSESLWRKISDRLERGEKSSIKIQLSATDENFKHIELSVNKKQREKQVAEIQDRFIGKIPKEFPLTNVKKDEAYLFVSMDVNLALLNYLHGSRGSLRIVNALDANNIQR